MPSLIEAVKKGAKVDILWGQNEKAADGRSTFKVATKLREEIAASGFSNVLRVHPFSTRSHAKLIICDEGNPNRLVAIVGSCNWFYSNFTSFDVSARLRDPEIVSDVLFQVAELSRGIERHWTNVTDEFARLAVNVRQQPNPGGARAIGTLVTGPEHGRFVREARDRAKSRIFVMSHRLGAASKAFILPPTQAAAEIRDLDVKIYYGVVNPEMHDDAPKLISAAAAAGVRLRPVYNPTIHAKVLAWDDDYLLITSRNWLSADSSESNPLGEIGLYRTCPEFCETVDGAIRPTQTLYVAIARVGHSLNDTSSLKIRVDADIGINTYLHLPLLPHGICPRGDGYRNPLPA